MAQKALLKSESIIKAKFFLTDSISLEPQQWMDGTIINHLRAKKWNDFLKLRMMDVTSELIKLDVEGKLNSMTSAELKKRLMLLCGAVEESETFTIVGLVRVK